MNLSRAIIIQDVHFVSRQACDGAPVRAVRVWPPDLDMFTHKNLCLFEDEVVFNHFPGQCFVLLVIACLPTVGSSLAGHDALSGVGDALDVAAIF